MMNAKIFIAVAIAICACAIVVTLFVIVSLFNDISALYEDVMEELHDFKVSISYFLFSFFLIRKVKDNNKY